MMTVDLTHLTQQQRQDVLTVIDDMLLASRRLNLEALRMQGEFHALTSALETFKRNVERWPVSACPGKACPGLDPGCGTGFPEKDKRALRPSSRAMRQRMNLARILINRARRTSRSWPLRLINSDGDPRSGPGAGGGPA